MTDRLDPQIAALLTDRASRAGNGTRPDARAVRAAEAARPDARPAGPSVAEVRDLVIGLRNRSLPIRCYRGTVDDVVVVFFHGGGFVTGDLETHDAQARYVCALTGRSVVSVAYRLAPEHPFPAAYDDAVEAMRWIRHHAAELPGRVDLPTLSLAVVGPSAGANLAVGVSLALVDEAAAPVAQLLAYPMLSGDPALASRTEFGEGFGLTSQAIEWCIEAYHADPSDRADPRFAPLESAAVRSLPPTVVVGAGLDPLRDEARVCADRLSRAAVPVRHFEEPTLPHGFWKYAPVSDAAHRATVTMCEAFRDLLDTCGDSEPSGSPAN